MNIEFRFNIEDTVYARMEPGSVARGTVKSRHWSEDEKGTRIEYRAQFQGWEDVIEESYFFATAEEAFAK